MGLDRVNIHNEEVLNLERTWNIVTGPQHMVQRKKEREKDPKSRKTQDTEIVPYFLLIPNST